MLISRNVVIRTGRTSLKMDEEFWAALREIADREGTTVSGVVMLAEAERHRAQANQVQLRGENREAARTESVKAYVLRYFREAATEHGHEDSGHGKTSPAPRDARASERVRVGAD